MRWDVWWRLNRDLPQQGPGSDASTRRALTALGALPSGPRVLDMGCGNGRQTLALLSATDGHVTALDLLAPFLERLTASARAAGFATRVDPVRADMRRPPFDDGAFDLLWSEGAVYLAGFEEGLARWRRLVRPGGAAAVTELSWLAEPPEEARAFWQTHYPAMGSVEQNVRRAERAGWRVLEHFVLPLSDWRRYYDPILERAERLRPEYRGDEEALSTLLAHEPEVEVLERSAGSYSYVFYLLRRDDTAQRP